MWKDQLILDVLWEDQGISFTTQTLDTFVPRSKMRQKTIVHLTVLNCFLCYDWSVSNNEESGFY